MEVYLLHLPDHLIDRIRVSFWKASASINGDASLIGGVGG